MVRKTRFRKADQLAEPGNARSVAINWAMKWNKSGLTFWLVFQIPVL